MLFIIELKPCSCIVSTGFGWAVCEGRWRSWRAGVIEPSEGREPSLRLRFDSLSPPLWLHSPLRELAGWAVDGEGQGTTCKHGCQAQERFWWAITFDRCIASAKICYSNLLAEVTWSSRQSGGRLPLSSSLLSQLKILSSLIHLVTYDLYRFILCQELCSLCSLLTFLTC